jgi:MFS family permease
MPRSGRRFPCGPGSALMAPIASLLKASPPARRFFAAYLQSSLGTGLGYVALVLVALERFGGSWSVAALLLADLVPLMALGPLLGAAADRLPRRVCVVVADLARAVAFAGIALAGDIDVALGFAILAGAATGVFNAAALSGLPGLAGERHTAAATSLFSTISTLGKTLGPIVGAAALAGGGVELALLVNAASFLLSAIVLATVDLGRAPASEASETHEPEAKGPLRAAGGFRMLVAAGTAITLFGGICNVAEPSLVTEDLSAGQAAFSILVAAYGLGLAAGAMTGSRGGAPARLWTAYVIGVLAFGAGLAAAAAAPGYALVLPAFALAGLGNGLVLVHERLLVQALVAERALGRAFGTLDMAASWAFGVSLLCGAAFVEAAGARGALLAAGAGALVVGVACALALAPRRARRPVLETG